MVYHKYKVFHKCKRGTLLKKIIHDKVYTYQEFILR